MDDLLKMLEQERIEAQKSYLNICLDTRLENYEKDILKKEFENTRNHLDKFITDLTQSNTDVNDKKDTIEKNITEFNLKFAVNPLDTDLITIANSITKDYQALEIIAINNQNT
jgi:hypothetical protein